MDELSLPKTKLAYRDGLLIKTGKDDVVLASFTRKDITSIRTEKSILYGAIALPAIFIALAIVSRCYIPSGVLNWLAIIASFAIAAFTFCMIFTQKVVIETKNGEVSYPVNDGFEEADGFALSIMSELGEGNEHEIQTK